MSENTSPVRKTYFGVAAFITSILCVLSLLSNFGVANLNIPQEIFNQLNNLTALFYCVLTQMAVVLGVIGHTRKNDSKVFSRIAIVLVTIPFLIIFAQFVQSFLGPT
jgi:cytochrome bd-type quinol oxidase subunit 2